MRQMQPVLWTKGVLLSPQHLQTQDRFLEDLIQFQLSGLTYCPWGFHRLEIDHEALAAFRTEAEELLGIEPKSDHPRGIGSGRPDAPGP